MFVVSKEFVKAEHNAKMKSVYVQKVLPDIERLEGAFKSGVWNPKTSPLCSGAQLSNVNTTEDELCPT
jgi:hypothetical protein